MTFNGIRAESGDYWTPPLPESVLGSALESHRVDPCEGEFIARFSREERERKELRHRILRPGVRPKDLASAGWGVVFPGGGCPEIIEQLQPLLTWRERQARGLYKNYSGVDAYRLGSTAQTFLNDRGAGSGPVDPQNVPYYLLLVGSPEEIAYAVQSQLGVRHAVGRLHFDELEDYGRYAESVVAAERSAFEKKPREVVFFGVDNPGDDATRRSRSELIEPLSARLSSHGWKVDVVEGEAADRQKLKSLLGGAETPPILFTASHGVVYPRDEWPWETQKHLQGALLCSDWPGPGSRVKREYYLAGEDLADEASLTGTICFHMACYSAGTPRWDHFAYPETDEAWRDATGQRLGGEITSKPFVAALPKRLLSLPEGRGALAVVGHVDRTWTSSFSLLAESSELAVIESVLEELLTAFPLGHAMRYMSRRYADLASDLTVATDPSSASRQPSAVERSRLWRAQSDARNFIILGDPAVRLPSAIDRPRLRWRDGRPALRSR